MCNFHLKIFSIFLYASTSLAIKEIAPVLPPNNRQYEVYVESGSRCQSRCASFGLRCTSEGGDTKPDWYCKNGYARLNWDGECVPIFSSKCFNEWPESPITCRWRSNEVYSEGMSACGDNCDTIGVPCQIYTLIAVTGCTCKPGYARYQGSCIKITDRRCSEQYLPSPTTCRRRPNEMFINDGPTCQENCMWYGVPCEPKKSCDTIKACYCKPGFIRVYENTDCVPIDTPNCQRWIPTAESCPFRFEDYKETSACQTTCATYGQQCSYNKTVKACHCREGFARISERGECVPIDSEECRSQMPRRLRG